MEERKSLAAVCFDYRGTLLDHKSDEELVAGMEEILSSLRERNIPMALVSRFPADVLKERLGELGRFFGDNVYSGSGEGKLECIGKFAASIGIQDLSTVAFVDDKPDNFVPAAEQSDVFVVGFAGSGKYADVRDVCGKKGIVYADSAAVLKEMLLSRIGG